MADVALSPEAVEYLAVLRERTPSEISAWRHRLERNAVIARGAASAARARAGERAFRDEANSPGGGASTRSPLGAWDEDCLT